VGFGITDQHSLLFSKKGSIVQYFHTVSGTHETSEAD
jgi:hypothetical protein